VSFEACRAGLSKWARGREIATPPRPRLTWAAGLEVRINPEPRLTVDGRPFLAKLHFKAAELDDIRRDNTLCLLAEAAALAARRLPRQARRRIPGGGAVRPSARVGRLAEVTTDMLDRKDTQ